MVEDLEVSFDYLRYRKQIRILMWVAIVALLIITGLLFSYKATIENCKEADLIPVPDGSMRGFGCVSQEEYDRVYKGYTTEYKIQPIRYT